MRTETGNAIAATDLVLEHRGGGSHSRRLCVRRGAELFMIGSSRAADLRLAGKGVGGCHIAIKRSEDGWLVCDLTGTESARADGAAFVERPLEVGKPLALQIGPHLVTLYAKVPEGSLFAEKDASAAQASGPLGLHEVVVRDRNGRVVEVKILRAGQAFVARDGAQRVSLASPSSAAWTSTVVGVRVVQQRLIPAQAAAIAEGFSLDRNLKKPFLMAFALLMFLSLLSFVAGLGKAPEAVLDAKSKDIIFNSQAIKVKRAESKRIASSRAQKRSQSAPSSAQASTPSESTSAAPGSAAAPKSSAKASKALASMRASGLSALVGRIAKRASKQGVFVASMGAASDASSGGAIGAAFGGHGASTVGGGAGGAKQGASFKLGGVGTAGKGGGVGGLARGSGTGLATGNVGAGDVALVDEETVVEGGLDRDVIADIIKKNLGQIRYCYERQLSSNPDLYGKVMVKFTIDAGGAVGEPKIDGSTMKSALVEGCILRRVATWKFPLPKGGTQVKVAYPFLFKAMQ